MATPRSRKHFWSLDSELRRARSSASGGGVLVRLPIVAPELSLLGIGLADARAPGPVLQRRPETPQARLLGAVTQDIAPGWPPESFEVAHAFLLTRGRAPRGAEVFAALTEPLSTRGAGGSPSDAFPSKLHPRLPSRPTSRRRRGGARVVLPHEEHERDHQNAERSEDADHIDVGERRRLREECAAKHAQSLVTRLLGR